MWLMKNVTRKRNVKSVLFIVFVCFCIIIIKDSITLNVRSIFMNSLKSLGDFMYL